MLNVQMKCIGCGRDFTLTAGERQFFASRGLSQPRRCKTCRHNARTAATVSGKPKTERPPKPGRAGAPVSRRPEACRHCGTPDGVVFETSTKAKIPHGVTYWAKDGDDMAPWLYRIRIQSTGAGRWRCQYCGKSW